MTQRIPSLRGIDPLTVPLPAGTEVVERLPSLADRLDEARARSPLPEAPPNEDEIEAWLLEARKRRW